MRRRGTIAAFAGGLLLAAGCASSPPPAPADAGEAASAAAEPLPLAPLPADDGDRAGGAAAEERVEGPRPAPADEVAAPSAAAPESEAAPSDAPPTRRPPAGEPVRRQMIVIDEGSGQARPEPGELARSTRRDAAASRGASPRVTNDNLADYARRGRVTVSGPAASPPGAAADGQAPGETGTAAAAAAGEPGPGEEIRDEAWWRARTRALREEWRRTVDEIGELEETAADLRWRFYAEDDPWIRDGQVKPEWDRALDRLSEARRRLGDYPRRLEALIEEGRREGALPGWLREGIELEPRPEELPAAEPDPAEPVEPRQVDEQQRGRGR